MAFGHTALGVLIPYLVFEVKTCIANCSMANVVNGVVLKVPCWLAYLIITMTIREDMVISGSEIFVHLSHGFVKFSVRSSYVL